MTDQLHAPTALPLCKVSGTHEIGSWLGPKIGLGPFHVSLHFSITKTRHYAI